MSEFSPVTANGAQPAATHPAGRPPCAPSDGAGRRTISRQQRARAMRDQGMKLREIAAEFGVAFQTVHAWLADPDGSKLRARKDSYRGICDLCGGSTDGSNGRDKAPDLCKECRSWTPEQIIAAIRKWADEHGGIPPTAADWRHADVDHPAETTVGRRIGWNEALLQAGFALRCDRRPETQEWILAQLRAGWRVEEIANALGVTPRNIYGRLGSRGLRVSQVRDAA